MTFARDISTDHLGDPGFGVEQEQLFVGVALGKLLNLSLYISTICQW